MEITGLYILFDQEAPELHSLYFCRPEVTHSACHAWLLHGAGGAVWNMVFSEFGWHVYSLSHLPSPHTGPSNPRCFNRVALAAYLHASNSLFFESLPPAPAPCSLTYRILDRDVSVGKKPGASRLLSSSEMH